MWGERLRLGVGWAGGWGVLHCHGTSLIPCEWRIYLMHHGFLTKRKERRRKAMIWAEMRRGESKPAKAGGWGWWKEVLRRWQPPPPLPAVTLAEEIDVRVS